MASACAACAQPLTVRIQPDSDDEQEHGAAEDREVPDDVQLQACGCRFHWQCLLDAFEGPQCPKCGTNIASPSSSSTDPAIMVNLHNEGGVQTDVDIADALREEAHLRAHPAERRARAFVEFCRAGDPEAIVQLLRNDEEESDEDEAMDTSTHDAPPVDILRYQDPLDHGRSGLHCAVLSGHQDVAWLLLYMASQLPLDEFPELLRGQAEGVGLVRESLAGETDIRGLRDAHGKTAEDLARGLSEEEGASIWHEWLGRQRLSL